MMKHDSEEDDSVAEEEDDDFVPEGEIDTGLQSSFRHECFEDLPGEEKKVNRKEEINQPIQVMFILFSHFRDRIADIASQYYCSIKIIMNKLKVMSEDTDQNSFEQCVAKVKEEVKKIQYFKVTKVDGIFKIYNSPYFSRLAGKNKLSLIKFDKNIYSFSNKLTENELRAKTKLVCHDSHIFQIVIKNPRVRDVPIYDAIRKFIDVLITYHEPVFKNHESQVQIGNSLDCLYCISKKTSGCMFAKNVMRNDLESMVIVIVHRDISTLESEKNIQNINLYLKKKVSYPFYAGQVNKTISTIITKENVMKKIFEKEKFRKLLNFSQKDQLGIFIPYRFHFKERTKMIEEICNKKGFDFSNNVRDIFHYFKQIFTSENHETNFQQLLSIFSEVMESWKDAKDRYDVYFRKKAREQEKVPFSGEYLSTGFISVDQDSSLILKRQIMKEEVKIQKTALVAYNAFDGEEKQNVYWYEDEEKNKKILPLQELQPGKFYFKGKIKTYDNETVFFIQFRIEVL